MSVTYKITYEHKDGKVNRSEELLVQSEHEPTQDEVQEAVRRDAARFTSTTPAATSAAELTVISVVPVP
ncbi:hypothetical protein [Enterobacter sp. R1(2018)]|uniref:hypothetical protein n=1 Tax=Enterobacter sp. R1(2018) TaxID=2447891 RepID=UPI000EAF2E42|nr:hypothetical protein [Enterobacter sp. R1(2018)]RKQ41486.1 hypothetical protein D8M09_00560 [Enterobacter sp. R1(2018)]